MKLRFEAAVRCEIGKVRGNNEDNFCFGRTILRQINQGKPKVKRRRFWRSAFLGVFDGMGGHQCGERASYLAAKAAREGRKSLPELCQRMNDAICADVLQSGCGRMGSTAVMVLLEKNKGYVCNLGDSRAFLLRDGALEQLTEDHTDEKANLALGVIRRPRLTQHLGLFAHELELEPYLKELELHRGDRFLLCSDGLTDMLTGEEICRIMEDGNCKDCVDRLVDAALDRGGKDNVTVIVCDVI